MMFCFLSKKEDTYNAVRYTISNFTKVSNFGLDAMVFHHSVCSFCIILFITTETGICVKSLILRSMSSESDLIILIQPPLLCMRYFKSFKSSLEWSILIFKAAFKTVNRRPLF